MVAGFGIFGGATHYDYELELLEFQSEPPLVDGGVGSGISPAETLLTHSQRWSALEITKGGRQGSLVFHQFFFALD